MARITEYTEDLLKICRNKQCPRYSITVVRDSDLCSACKRKLTKAKYLTETHDIPPLIDHESPDGFFGHLWQTRGHPESFPARTVPRQLPVTVGEVEYIRPTAPAANDVFTCATAIGVKGCPTAPKPTVEVPQQLFRQWVFLCNELDTEWIAYLRGEQAENGDWRITGMYFPQQKVTGGHCEPLDQQIEPDTIGAVHSHVAMGAFFSSEDEAHFNHPVEVVVNRDGKCLANVRITLQCGKPSRVDGSVVLTGCEAEMQLAAQLREKVIAEAKCQSWEHVHSYYCAEGMKDGK